jgi:hypothetical protein
LLPVNFAARQTSWCFLGSTRVGIIEWETYGEWRSTVLHMWPSSLVERREASGNEPVIS